MEPRDTAENEVKVFEYNAKEGVRSVALYWFVRRVAHPVSIALMLMVSAATAANGVLAGLMSLLVFGIPFLFVWWIVWMQARKHAEYLDGYRPQMKVAESKTNAVEQER